MLDEKNIYCHIVDHDGFGTMHRIIKPLCDVYSNHILIEQDEFINNSDLYKNNIIVLHTSGGGRCKIFYDIKKYKNFNFIIFVHTSYNYQMYKNREKFILILEEYSKCSNIRVVVPSKQVMQQYESNNIKCQVVQLGISKIENDKEIMKNKESLKKYYDKIVTTCSSKNSDYIYIKGIDIFKEIVYRNNLQDKSIVLGIDELEDLESVSLNEKDFLNVLYHSKAYVQFSRFESYNISAVQSKRLKLPVVLLRAEGNCDCMDGNVYDFPEEVENEILKILSGKKNDKLIDNLYGDSVNRENLENYRKSLEKINIWKK